MAFGTHVTFRAGAVLAQPMNQFTRPAFRDLFQLPNFAPRCSADLVDLYYPFGQNRTVLPVRTNDQAGSLG